VLKPKNRTKNVGIWNPALHRYVMAMESGAVNSGVEFRSSNGRFLIAVAPAQINFCGFRQGLVNRP
jgi:hypothetical protein